MFFFSTEEMVGDFFTKLLQGAKFCKFRKIIMNLADDRNFYFFMKSEVLMRNDALSHSLIFIRRMVSQMYHRCVLKSEKLCTIVAKIALRTHHFIFAYTRIKKIV